MLSIQESGRSASEKCHVPGGKVRGSVLDLGTGPCPTGPLSRRFAPSDPNSRLRVFATHIVHERTVLSRWSRRPNRDKRARWHPLPRLRSHCVRLIVRWTMYDHRPTSTHTALPCSVELPASAPAREIIKDIQLIVPFTMIIYHIPPVGVTPELESPYADIQAFRFYGTHSQGSIAKGR